MADNVQSIDNMTQVDLDNRGRIDATEYRETFR